MAAFVQFGGSIIVLAAPLLDVADLYAREFMRVMQLHKWYVLSGVLLYLFGNRTTWVIQARILGQVKDDDALAFKRSVYDECTMIAVAVSRPIQVDVAPANLAVCNRSPNRYHSIVLERFKSDPLGC
jgi:hypothetical protein